MAKGSSICLLLHFKSPNSFKQIIKALKANPAVTDWLISEVSTLSHQAFYVMQKLETTRRVETTEYAVTVYHRFTENKVEYLGSSSFQVSHKLNKKTLDALISEAVFAASFIKNKNFDVVTGIKKKSWSESDYGLEPFALIDKIASLFIAASKPSVKFNSMELFHTKTTQRIVNSKAVDLKKTLYKVNVEAIPSYDGLDQKVELYKYYTYKGIDFDLIKNDAIEALADVTTRYQAKAIQKVKKIDVILKDHDVADFFENLIEDYSYAGIYRQDTDKKIGDSIQKEVKGELLTVSFVPSSKADAFDKDGVILKPVKVIDRGTIVNYYGANQFAHYLDMRPSGIMDTLEVQKGRFAYETMSKKPHLQIIALSGIQIDMYSGYIGGEVRLAVYFDGKESHPVSGFSFSGNIDKSLSHLKMSKELTKIASYQGPKYLKLKDMEIL